MGQKLLFTRRVSEPTVVNTVQIIFLSVKVVEYIIITKNKTILSFEFSIFFCYRTKLSIGCFFGIFDSVTNKNVVIINVRCLLVEMAVTTASPVKMACVVFPVTCTWRFSEPVFGILPPSAGMVGLVYPSAGSRRIPGGPGGRCNRRLAEVHRGTNHRSTGLFYLLLDGG